MESQTFGSGDDQQPTVLLYPSGVSGVMQRFLGTKHGLAALSVVFVVLQAVVFIKYLFFWGGGKDADKPKLLLGDDDDDDDIAISYICGPPFPLNESSKLSLAELLPTLEEVSAVSVSLIPKLHSLAKPPGLWSIDGALAALKAGLESSRHAAHLKSDWSSFLSLGASNSYELSWDLVEMLPSSSFPLQACASFELLFVARGTLLSLQLLPAGGSGGVAGGDDDGGETATAAEAAADAATDPRQHEGGREPPLCPNSLAGVEGEDLAWREKVVREGEWAFFETGSVRALFAGDDEGCSFVVLWSGAHADFQQEQMPRNFALKKKIDTCRENERRMREAADEDEVLVEDEAAEVDAAESNWTSAEKALLKKTS